MVKLSFFVVFMAMMRRLDLRPPSVCTMCACMDFVMFMARDGNRCLVFGNESIARRWWIGLYIVSICIPFCKEGDLNKIIRYVKPRCCLLRVITLFYLLNVWAFEINPTSLLSPARFRTTQMINAWEGVLTAASCDCHPLLSGVQHAYDYNCFIYCFSP